MTATDVVLAADRLSAGGVGRVTLHLANGMATRGLNVALALTDGNDVLRERVEPRVRQVVLNGGKLKRGAGLMRAAPELAALLDGGRPAVLLSAGNHMHATAALAHRLASVRGTALVLKLTNPIVRGRALNAGGRRWWSRRLLPRASMIMTLTSAAAAAIAQATPQVADRIRVIDNPYVEDRGAAPRRVIGAAPRLLAVGRLVPQKDHVNLLDALSRIAHRPWQLTIVGDGPLRSKLVALVAELGLGDRIEFVGHVSDPRPYFEQADLFVLPSAYEELPAVLFEAAAAGCGIVATAASRSIMALFEEADLGTLVAPRDSAALAAAIADGLTADRAQGGAERVLARYGIDAGIDSHLSALRPFLDPSRGSR